MEALIIGALGNVIGGLVLHRLLGRTDSPAPRARWTFDVHMHVRREIPGDRTLPPGDESSEDI
jgi:hypothetical protein